MYIPTALEACSTVPAALGMGSLLILGMPVAMGGNSLGISMCMQ